MGFYSFEQGRNWGVNLEGEYGGKCLLVVPDEFFLKSVVVGGDFKRNLSGKTRIHERTCIPPPSQLTLLLRPWLQKHILTEEIVFVDKHN